MEHDSRVLELFLQPDEELLIAIVLQAKNLSEVQADWESVLRLPSSFDM